MQGKINMDKQELISFVVFVVDMGIVLYFGMIIYGLIKGNIYIFGNWYNRSEKSKFYQTVAVYIGGGCSYTIALFYFHKNFFSI